MWGTLLIADDDLPFVDAIATRFRGVGMTVVVESSGAALVDLADCWHPDVAVVNLELSGVDVLELFRRIRRNDPRCFLFACLDALSGVDAVLACEAGADDCFSNRIDVTLLEAKVRCALRRRAVCARCNGERHLGRNSDIRSLGTPSAPGIDTSCFTRFEERLLATLSAARGNFVATRELLHYVWGKSDVDPKLLYDHVSSLRRKLKKYDLTISNARGSGYCLTPMSEAVTLLGPSQRSRGKVKCRQAGQGEPG